MDPSHFSQCLAASYSCGPSLCNQHKYNGGYFDLLGVTIDRSRLWSVQTPQTFRVDVIRRALGEVRRRGMIVTDDTAACELIGQPVRLVVSTQPNPKVTRPRICPTSSTCCANAPPDSAFFVVRFGKGAGLYEEIPMSGAHESLSEFVRNGSEAAFRELVTSYMDFVYSTALRVLGGDGHLAEDVAQNVFIDLAKKAHTLPGDVKLGGWLHRHTCFLARKALRGEGRRKARERRAVELQAINDCTDEKVALLTSVLDEAIEDLGTHDRTAILLRFFESLDFRSLGRKMGSTEDAARMRVSRALEKLASLLKGRGFTFSVSALTFILGAKVLGAAPAHFASRVAAIAHAAGSKSRWLRC